MTYKNTSIHKTTLRMKKLCLLASLLIFSAALVYSQNTVLLSLNEAIAYAKANNADLVNAELGIENSKQEVKSVIASGLPQVTASANFTHNLTIASTQLPDFISPTVYSVLINEGVLTPDKFRVGQPQTVQFGAPSSLTGSVNLSQLVFDGTYFMGLRSAKHYVHLSELIKANTEVELVEKIKKAYYGSLITKQNFNLLKDNLTILEKTQAETKALLKSGFAEQLDVDRLSLAISNIQTQINNLSYQQQIMNYVLKVVMGMDVNTAIELTGRIDESLLQPRLMDEFNAKNRTEYQLLNQQLLLDSLNIKRYKVGYYPSLTLNANYQQNSFASSAPFNELGNIWNPGSMYSFNLNIPIFDGFYKQSKISQARLKFEMDKNTFDATLNAMMMEVEQAKLNVRIQSNNLRNQIDSRALAKSIYQTTKTKFEAGMSSSFELIQAQNDLSRADIDHSNALYQLIVAQIELETALGSSNK